VPMTLTLRVPQAPEYLPGDRFDLYWNGGVGALPAKPVRADVAFWPGQELQGPFYSRLRFYTQTLYGGPTTRATCFSRTLFAGGVYWPAGTCDVRLGECGPGMHRFQVDTEDGFENVSQTAFNRWLCTAPHAPRKFKFSGPGLVFSFLKSRSF